VLRGGGGAYHCFHLDGVRVCVCVCVCVCTYKGIYIYAYYYMYMICMHIYIHVHYVCVVHIYRERGAQNCFDLEGVNLEIEGSGNGGAEAGTKSFSEILKSQCPGTLRI
jgi:hypothetical protein